LLRVASQFCANEPEQTPRNAKIATEIRAPISIDIFAHRKRSPVVSLSNGWLRFIGTKKIHASLARVYFEIVGFDC